MPNNIIVEKTVSSIEEIKNSLLSQAINLDKQWRVVSQYFGKQGELIIILHTKCDKYTLWFVFSPSGEKTAYLLTGRVARRTVRQKLFLTGEAMEYFERVLYDQESLASKDSTEFVKVQELKETLDECFNNSSSLEDFIPHLKKKGVRVHLDVQKDNEGRIRLCLRNIYNDGETQLLISFCGIQIFHKGELYNQIAPFGWWEMFRKYLLGREDAQEAKVNSFGELPYTL